MTKETMKTYLIVHEDDTERKITVPDSWKVTFGPAAAGNFKSNSPRNSLRMPLALRFYENEKQQRAIFTDVVSFRDMSIITEVKRIDVQEKEGFMECEGKRKATTFRTEVSEWVNPDDDGEKRLPFGGDVENFDVEFKEVD